MNSASRTVFCSPMQYFASHSFDNISSPCTAWSFSRNGYLIPQPGVYCKAKVRHYRNLAATCGILAKHAYLRPFRPSMTDKNGGVVPIVRTAGSGPLAARPSPMKRSRKRTRAGTDRIQLN